MAAFRHVYITNTSCKFPEEAAGIENIMRDLDLAVTIPMKILKPAKNPCTVSELRALAGIKRQEMTFTPAL